MSGIERFFYKILISIGCWLFAWLDFWIMIKIITWICNDTNVQVFYDDIGIRVLIIMLIYRPIFRATTKYLLEDNKD